MRRGAIHGLQLSTFLSPLLVWSKWTVAGVPISKIPFSPSRLELLKTVAGAAPRDGLWLEFGVWTGESLNVLAPQAPGVLYGFDSFEGLPTGWTPNFKRGAFSTGGKLPRTTENVVIVKGLFQDTLPSFLLANPSQMVSFAHIDSDLYESARFVLGQLAHRIGRHTVLVFDEYTGIMPDDEARAFREIIRVTGLPFHYIGCSANGSVAVMID